MSNRLLLNVLIHYFAHEVSVKEENVVYNLEHLAANKPGLFLYGTGMLDCRTENDNESEVNRTNFQFKLISIYTKQIINISWSPHQNWD